jgi:membrane protease YdiL (CAAX protease family)
MGLLEFLFERRNPGKVGHIDKNNQSLKQISKKMLLFKIIITFLSLGALIYYTILDDINLSKAVTFIVILVIYCVISFYIIPRPDTSNLGLLGGIFDHPFRYTDDLNRILIVLYIILIPGRFIATTILQTIALLKKKK